MKLYHSPTSPYARKVRVTMIELGISGRIELVATNPMETPFGATLPNPLQKVPTLQLTDGSVIIDSPVICAYLASLISDNHVLAPTGPSHWRALRIQAMADGIMDAAFSIVMEKRRPEAQQSPEWLARWESAILKTPPEIGRALLGEPGFGLGEIAVACALGYLDFRLPHLDWRATSPLVSSWYARVSKRPSFMETAPH